jgi:hypothetical protein
MHLLEEKEDESEEITLAMGTARKKSEKERINGRRKGKR